MPHTHTPPRADRRARIRVDDAVMEAKFGWPKRIRDADGRHIEML
jgi:hypothetical protein